MSIDLLLNIGLQLPILVIVFILGSAIGSFMNVVVYRIPANLSILWPPSRCPHCLTRLGMTENVPVFGWLWLKGHCRHCHQPISWRYPVVEAATGLLFVAVFAGYGVSFVTLGYWIFFSWLLALSLIDLDTMTLPNPLTQSGLLLGLGFQWILGWGTTFNFSQGVDQLMMGIVGAVIGMWLFEIISLVGSMVFGQPAMGMGDAKLAAMMGAWLGWKLLLVGSFVACAAGAGTGSVGMALGWLDRRQPLPFGPFLAVGAGVAAVWGEGLISTYLLWFFPPA